MTQKTNSNSLIFLAQSSQIKVAMFSMTKQMRTCSLFKRQLSLQNPWIQYLLEMIQTYSSSCYTTCLHTARISFLPQIAKKNTKGPVWNIKEVQAKLGTFVCKHIPFLHAFLGCDTTSRLFGIEKGSILKKFKENKSPQQAATVFDISMPLRPKLTKLAKLHFW